MSVVGGALAMCDGGVLCDAARCCVILRDIVLRDAARCCDAA